MNYNPYTQTMCTQQFEQTQPNQFQQTIYNGGFGQSMPNNNIIQVGGNPYQQMYNQYDNNINNYRNQQLSNYYAQQQYQQQNTYPQQGYSYYQEPRVDYYNPWGMNNYQQQPQYSYDYGYQNPQYSYMYGYQQQPQYGYGYQQNYYPQQPYYNNGYNQYGNYGYIVIDGVRYENDPLCAYRALANMANDYCKLGLTQEEIEERINPKPKKIEITDEMIEEAARMRHAGYIANIINNYEPINENNCSFIRDYNNTVRKFNEYHKNYANHSMYEFICKDLPQFLYGFWLEENLAPNQDRNLSTLYDSNSYNELLKIHASQNPYSSYLLNNSNYDNNMSLDRSEVGLDVAFNLARRREELARISDPETVKKRELATQKIIDQIRAKKEGRI